MKPSLGLLGLSFTQRKRLKQVDSSRHGALVARVAEEDPWEIIYFKLYKSQIPVIEQSLQTAALMLGSTSREATAFGLTGGRTVKSWGARMLWLPTTS